LREWPRFEQLEAGSGPAGRRAKRQAGTAAAAVTGRGMTAGPLGSVQQRVHTGTSVFFIFVFFKKKITEIYFWF